MASFFARLVRDAVLDAMDVKEPELQPYEYDSLPTKTSIRLVTIARDRTYRYAMSMRTFELSEAPPYHALSYTWRNPHQWPELENEYGEPISHYEDRHSGPLTFKCDGRAIVVEPGQNLHEALLRFGSGRLLLNPMYNVMEHEYLWIDAICINQSAKAMTERKEQVLRMGKIYHKASSVLAWLGEDLPNTLMGLEVLVELEKIPMDKVEEMRSLDIRDDATYSALGIREIYKTEWRTVFAVLSREWFNRVWTVQEAAFARKILFIWGRHVIESPGLFKVAKLLILSGWTDQIMHLIADMVNPKGIQLIDLIAVRVENRFTLEKAATLRNVAAVAQMQEDVSSGKKIDALDILASTRSRQAGEPLDNVYGLLNLLAKAMNIKPEKMDVQPDYTRELFQVMEDTILMMIRRSSDLKVLHQVQERSLRQGIKRSPSWAVHWGIKLAPLPLVAISRLETGWNPAGKSTEPLGLDLSIPHKLKFKSAHLSTVAELCPPTEELDGNLISWLELLESLYQKPYGARIDQGWTEILWRTVLVDIAGNHNLASLNAGEAFMHNFICMQRLYALKQKQCAKDELNLGEEVEAKLSRLRELDSRSAFPGRSIRRDIIRAFEGEDTLCHELSKEDLCAKMELQSQALQPHLDSVMANRRLARTAKNLLCVVPASTKKGYVVRIIPGRATPFVFKEVAPKEYVLVGEAYVHGAMGGEFAHKLSFEDTVLR